jgi:hypothetical protein
LFERSPTYTSPVGATATPVGVVRRLELTADYAQQSQAAEIDSMNAEERVAELKRVLGLGGNLA